MLSKFAADFEKVGAELLTAATLDSMFLVMHKEM